MISISSIHLKKLIWLTYERSRLRILEKKVNVSARVLSSYIFSSLLMLLMFINIAFRFPFEEMPVYFSFMVAILLVLAFSTSFTAFYNVFYESKDLASYRPYAFKESEIIIAKGLSVLLPALPGIVQS